MSIVFDLCGRADGSRWNQTIVLPITYPSLLLTSQITFTIWDVQGAGKAVPVGGTTMSLFTKKRCVIYPKHSYPANVSSHKGRCGGVNRDYLYIDELRRIQNPKPVLQASYQTLNRMRWVDWNQ